MIELMTEAHVKSFQLSSAPKLVGLEDSESLLCRFRGPVCSKRERLEVDADEKFWEILRFAQLGRPHCFCTALALFSCLYFSANL